MLMLTATGHEVYTFTIENILSNSYDALDKTLNHLKSIKLNSYLGENVADLYSTILLDTDFP